jgi:hypothetical protein
MPGPSLFIRQQTPIATPANDGLMSATQAVAVASVSGNQAANTVFAGPASGTDAPPTYRPLVGADLPPAVFFSTAAFASARGGLIAQSGNTATGAMFAVDRTLKVLGATWMQPLALLPVQVELWTYNGSWASVASVTVDPPVEGVLNTGLFASPVTAVITQPYAIVVYDGTNQLLYSPLSSDFSSFTQPGQGWTNGSNSAATIWGPGVWIYGYGYSTSGNTPGLLTLNVPTYTGLDLLYEF